MLFCANSATGNWLFNNHRLDVPSWLTNRYTDYDLPCHVSLNMQISSFTKNHSSIVQGHPGDWLPRREHTNPRCPKIAQRKRTGKRLEQLNKKPTSLELQEILNTRNECNHCIEQDFTEEDKGVDKQSLTCYKLRTSAGTELMRIPPTNHTTKVIS